MKEWHQSSQAFHLARARNTLESSSPIDMADMEEAVQQYGMRNFSNVNIASMHIADRPRPLIRGAIKKLHRQVSAQ
jgi:hypothetical protein